MNDKNLEKIQNVARSVPFIQLLDIEVTELNTDQDTLTMTMPITNQVGRMLSMPQIHGGAVVSLPDASRGAIPVAFVVCAEPALTEDEVKAYAREAGPAYRHPRKVYFLDAFPLSAVNKDDKLALTKLAEASN